MMAMDEQTKLGMMERIARLLSNTEDPPPSDPPPPAEEPPPSPSDPPSEDPPPPSSSEEAEFWAEIDRRLTALEQAPPYTPPSKQPAQARIASSKSGARSAPDLDRMTTSEIADHYRDKIRPDIMAGKISGALK